MHPDELEFEVTVKFKFKHTREQQKSWYDTEDPKKAAETIEEEYRDDPLQIVEALQYALENDEPNVHVEYVESSETLSND